MYYCNNLYKLDLFSVTIECYQHSWLLTNFELLTVTQYVIIALHAYWISFMLQKSHVSRNARKGMPYYGISRACIHFWGGRSCVGYGYLKRVLTYLSWVIQVQGESENYAMPSFVTHMNLSFGYTVCHFFIAATVKHK